MLAHCEAYIDFEADELSDPRLSETFAELLVEVEEFKNKIRDYIDSAKVSEIIKEGFRVSILGPPNAGKSTLMNMLAKREVSIVSQIPGTTRDLIQASINMRGINMLLTDTAGLRGITDDEIEKIGIVRAKAEASNSHAIIFVLDVNTLVPVSATNGVYKYRLPSNSEFQTIQDQILKSEGDNHPFTIFINKTDTLTKDSITAAQIIVGDVELTAIPTSFQDESEKKVTATLQDLLKTNEDNM